MNKILLTASLVGLLSGCGGGGGSSDTTIENGGITASGGTTVSLSDISGIWNATENTPFGQDIIYLAIDGNGIVKDYDYMGDTFDEGDACYWLTGHTANDRVQLTDNGGGNFTITSTDYGSVISTTMTAVLNGNNLTMTWVDTFDDDEDGNTTETQTMTMSRGTGLQESDFQPLCDDNGELPATNPTPPVDTTPSTNTEINLDDIKGTWNTNFLSLSPAAYVQITENGELREFEASWVHSENGWGTCYNEQAADTTVQLSGLGNNQFNADFMTNGLTLTTTITATEQYGFYDYALNFTDVTDRDGDGDTSETQTFELREVTDITKASLAPLCSDVVETTPITWRNICDSYIESAKATYGEPENDYKSVSSTFWYWSLDWYSKGISKTFTSSTYDSSPRCEVTNTTYTPF